MGRQVVYGLRRRSPWRQQASCQSEKQSTEADLTASLSVWLSVTQSVHCRGQALNIIISSCFKASNSFKYLSCLAYENWDEFDDLQSIFFWLAQLRSQRIAHEMPARSLEIWVKASPGIEACICVGHCDWPNGAYTQFVQWLPFGSKITKSESELVKCELHSIKRWQWRIGELIYI